jgi:superoxide reductase
MKISFYKCKKCGKVVAMLKGSPCDTMCCGEAMTELTANTTDAAVEKHVPVVTVNGNTVEVNVGSVTHPMEEKHFIEWIALETKNGNQLKYLKPGDAPKAVFALTDGDEVVRAYAYCNLHGLWADK